MKHLLVFVFALILLSCGTKNKSNTTQNGITSANIPIYCYKFFKGTINKNISIEMELSRNEAGLTATYIYTKYGESINLNGEYMDDGSLVLREYSTRSDTITGKFKGKYDGKTIVGTWQNGDSTKIYPLELIEQATNNVVFKDYRKTDSTQLKGRKEVAEVTHLYLHPIDYSDKNVIKPLANFTMNSYFQKNKISDNPEECIKKHIAVYFDSYRTDTKDLDIQNDDSGGFTWMDDNSMFIELNDKQLLCFAVNNYSFMGGVHGNMSSIYHTYDLKNLKELKKEDVFIKGYESKVIPMLKEAIIKQYPEGLTILNEPDSLIVSENFYVTPFGIGFFYNTYEVACYAVGQIDLVIPYRKIKSLLNPETLVYKLAQ